MAIGDKSLKMIWDTTARNPLANNRNGRMTKAAAVMVCVVVKKKSFCVISILMFGEEAVCPDGLFVPAIFREVRFYLNSLIWDTLFGVTPFMCKH